MTDKTKQIIRTAVTMLLGLVYGIIALYWVSMCWVMATGAYASDIGEDVTEAALLAPYGIIGLAFLAIVTVVIVVKLIKKGKWIPFVACAAAGALGFYGIWYLHWFG